MKTALILALSCISLNAELLKLDTLKTAKGKTYEAVTVTEKRPDGISIRHAAGTARIPQEDLPADVKRKLGGFDAAAAEDARKADAEALRAAERAMDDAEAAKAQGDEKTTETEQEMPPVEQLPIDPKAPKVEPRNADKLMVKTAKWGDWSGVEVTARAGAKPLRVVGGGATQEIEPWGKRTWRADFSSNYRIRAFEGDVQVDIELPRHKTGLGSDTRLR